MEIRSKNISWEELERLEAEDEEVLDDLMEAILEEEAEEGN